MLLKDLLFSPDVEQDTLLSCAGSLYGANISSISRKGDLSNRISLGSASVFVAKELTKESLPYYRERTDGVVTSILPQYHFLSELRKQLSGEVTVSEFSVEEETFYTEYQEYTEGVVKTDELLLAIEALDKWLVDEVTGVAHPELIRDYGSTHQWVKLEERIA